MEVGTTRGARARGQTRLPVGTTWSAAPSNRSRVAMSGAYSPSTQGLLCSPFGAASSRIASNNAQAFAVADSSATLAPNCSPFYPVAMVDTKRRQQVRGEVA